MDFLDALGSIVISGVIWFLLLLLGVFAWLMIRVARGARRPSRPEHGSQDQDQDQDE